RTDEHALVGPNVARALRSHVRTRVSPPGPPCHPRVPPEQGRSPLPPRNLAQSPAPAAMLTTNNKNVRPDRHLLSTASRFVSGGALTKLVGALAKHQGHPKK